MSMVHFRNTFYGMRHGDTKSNLGEILSSSPESSLQFPLTQKGIAEVKQSIKALRDKKVELVVSSPLLRTKQTALLVGEALGVPVWLDDRLREVDMGVFDGKSYEVYHEFFRTHNHSFDVPIPEGESWRQVAERMKQVVLDLDQKYEGATILLVSHEDPLALLDWSLRFTDPKDFEKASFLKTGEIMELVTRNTKQKNIKSGKQKTTVIPAGFRAGIQKTKINKQT